MSVWLTKWLTYCLCTHVCISLHDVRLYIYIHMYVCVVSTYVYCSLYHSKECVLNQLQWTLNVSMDAENLTISFSITILFFVFLFLFLTPITLPSHSFPYTHFDIFENINIFPISTKLNTNTIHFLVSFSHSFFFNFLAVKHEGHTKQKRNELYPKLIVYNAWIDALL